MSPMLVCGVCSQQYFAAPETMANGVSERAAAVLLDFMESQFEDMTLRLILLKVWGVYCICHATSG